MNLLSGERAMGEEVANFAKKNGCIHWDFHQGSDMSLASLIDFTKQRGKAQ